MTAAQQWMVDQIKIEANAVRQQIKGLPDDMQDRLTREVIDILGVKCSENRNWIRCRDRLPDKDGNYLVYAPGFVESIFACRFSTDSRTVYGMRDIDSNVNWPLPCWYDDEYDWGEWVGCRIKVGVTHWMPMPEPPTDETQKGDR